MCGRTGPPILRGRQILDELLLLAQICTKSFVGWGFAPDPTGGAYSAPPDPLTALRGPTSKGSGREEREREGRGREKGSRREGIAVEKNPYFKACSQSSEDFVACQGECGEWAHIGCANLSGNGQFVCSPCTK